MKILTSTLPTSDSLRRFGTATVTVLLFILSLSLPVSAEQMKDSQRGLSDEEPADEETQMINPIRESNYYVGIHNPGITLGYQGDGYSIALRASKQNDIKVYGPRYTHYVYPYQGGNFYWGVDAFHVEFEDVIVEGTGQMAGTFGGIQTYIGESISFSVDGGPYYVKLEDDVSPVSVDGIEFVINTGIQVHF